MKKDFDWKEMGRFVSFLVSLFTVIRDTLTKIGVGLEIIPWLVGDGKEIFVEKFLKPLGNNWLELRKFIIDCDESPYAPEGMVVNEHRKGGRLNWNAIKISLFLSESQMNGKCTKGHKLREMFKNIAVLNANVLDHLLVHKSLIPEEWRGKTVIFWGTIYSSSSGALYVRFLDQTREGEWCCFHGCLDDDFYNHCPAALLVS
jgi:hypothetical protein